MNKMNPYSFLNLKIYPNKSVTFLTMIIFFLIFFSATAAASFYFASIGAWPVSFFLLADFCRCSKCYYSAPVCVPPYVVSYAHLQDPI